MLQNKCPLLRRFLLIFIVSDNYLTSFTLFLLDRAE